MKEGKCCRTLLPQLWVSPKLPWSSFYCCYVDSACQPFPQTAAGVFRWLVESQNIMVSKEPFLQWIREMRGANQGESWGWGGRRGKAILLKGPTSASLQWNNNRDQLTGIIIIHLIETVPWHFRNKIESIFCGIAKKNKKCRGNHPKSLMLKNADKIIV